jgi:diaminopimelate decarboxylase
MDVNRRIHMTNNIEEVVQAAVGQGLLGPGCTAVGFIDFDGLRKTVAELHAAFPQHVLHRFAVKANSLPSYLAIVRKFGLHAEAASTGEVSACLRAGYSTNEISYNAPAKTITEIQGLLASNISFSIDNEQELERVRNLLACRGASTSCIGVRVNTQIGAGSIAATSTATSTSKFGFPLRDSGSRERLVEGFYRNDWLNMLHVHTGSQSVPLDMMAESIAHVVELAEDIDRRCGVKRVRSINIGGGLPVAPEPGTASPTFSDYTAVLYRRTPALFSGRFTVETEFGRGIAAPNGFAVARVEYVKEAGGRTIAITHAGAQIAARSVLGPQSWPLYVSVLDETGARVQRRRVRTDIAGPCCFASDLLCCDREMDEIRANDLVVLHNSGAYGFSSHFDFNMLPRPAIFSFRRGARSFEFECLRAAEDDWIFPAATTGTSVSAPVIQDSPER